MTRNWMIAAAVGAGLALGGGGVVAAVVANPASPVMTVYKSPTCGCCDKWIDHVREGGIEVEVEEIGWDELDRRMTAAGIGRELRSCHLGEIDGYMVVGHVPATDIARLLEERPEVAGVAVPGMPIGSPGMEQGDRVDPYATLAFTAAGETTVFQQHPDNGCACGQNGEGGCAHCGEDGCAHHGEDGCTHADGCAGCAGCAGCGEAGCAGCGGEAGCACGDDACVCDEGEAACSCAEHGQDGHRCSGHRQGHQAGHPAGHHGDHHD